jgi:hypothetical protein
MASVFAWRSASIAFVAGHAGREQVVEALGEVAEPGTRFGRQAADRLAGLVEVMGRLLGDRVDDPHLLLEVGRRLDRGDAHHSHEAGHAERRDPDGVQPARRMGTVRRRGAREGAQLGFGLGERRGQGGIAAAEDDQQLADNGH